MFKHMRTKLDADKYGRLCTAVFTRDKYRCRKCGRIAPLHAHHIVRRSSGGDDSLDNLVSLCFECHRALHDTGRVRNHDEFIMWCSGFYGG